MQRGIHYSTYPLTQSLSDSFYKPGMAWVPQTCRSLSLSKGFVNFIRRQKLKLKLMSFQCFPACWAWPIFTAGNKAAAGKGWGEKALNRFALAAVVAGVDCSSGERKKMCLDSHLPHRNNYLELPAYKVHWKKKNRPYKAQKTRWPFTVSPYLCLNQRW